MAEIGVLHPEMRVELLNGMVTDLYGQTPLHAAVTQKVAQRFLDLPKKNFIVSIHNPVRLDDFNELEPDVALLRLNPSYHQHRRLSPDDIFLVVEVADASLEYDHEKLLTYGHTGIAEVWIVNLNESAVEVYREPNFTGYASKTFLRPGVQAKSLAFPDIAVNVAELLRR